MLIARVRKCLLSFKSRLIGEQATFSPCFLETLLHLLPVRSSSDFYNLRKRGDDLMSFPLFVCLPHTQNFHPSIWGLSQDQLLKLIPRERVFTVVDSDLDRHRLSPFRLKFAR